LTKISNYTNFPATLTYGPSFKQFTVAEGNPNYSTDGTFLMNKDQTVIYGVACQDALVKSLTIPSTVTEIADYGMANNQLSIYGKSGITSLSLGNNLTKIGAYGLAYLANVATVTIPATVTYIGECAFSDWRMNQTIVFKCTRNYAAEHFHKDYMTGASCKDNCVYDGD